MNANIQCANPHSQKKNEGASREFLGCAQLWSSVMRPEMARSLKLCPLAKIDDLGMKKTERDCNWTFGCFDIPGRNRAEQRSHFGCPGGISRMVLGKKNVCVRNLGKH